MANFINNCSKPLDLKTSRSGRLLIPRLKTWTGERVCVKKGGVTEIVEGLFADLTTTFQPERSFIKDFSTINFSQTIGSPKAILPEKTRKPVVNKVKNTRRKKNVSKLPISPKFQSPPKPMTPPKPPPAPPIEDILKTPLKKQKLPSPNKILRKEKDPVKQAEPPPIDIWGPEFQPVVVLRRLLPDEIWAMTAPSDKSKPPKVAPRSTKVVKSRRTKQESKDLSPERKRGKSKKLRPQNVQSVKEQSDTRSRPAERKSPKSSRSTETPPKKTVKRSKETSSPLYRRPNTVKETQQILRELHRIDEPMETDDVQAALDAEAYMKMSCPPGIRRLTAALNILKDNFGESDDNLSFRSISERESSPMSSAVSPVGSVYESSDSDNSGADDCLTRGSPVIADRVSYHRARLVHRTVKERTLLQKRVQRKMTRTAANADDDAAASSSSDAAAISQVPFAPQGTCPQLYQPKMMRAFENKVKKKVKSGSAWDFSTYHKGTLLHVSVNSDSDEESVSSFDSLDEF